MKNFWISTIELTILVVTICICLSACAHYDKDKNVFYGWGSYKDKDVEMTSDPPLKILPLGR